jgi:hypothetical protein
MHAVRQGDAKPLVEAMMVIDYACLKQPQDIRRHTTKHQMDGLISKIGDAFDIATLWVGLVRNDAFEAFAQGYGFSPLIAHFLATENGVSILAGIFKNLRLEQQLPSIADQVAEGFNPIMDGEAVDGLEGEDIALNALVHQAPLEAWIAAVG